jgi:hypothetical protein
MAGRSSMFAGSFPFARPRLDCRGVLRHASVTTDFGYVQGGALVAQGYPAKLTGGTVSRPLSRIRDGEPKESGTTL